MSIVDELETINWPWVIILWVVLSIMIWKIWAVSEYFGTVKFRVFGIVGSFIMVTLVIWIMGRND